MSMFNIYEKDLNTDKVKLFMKVANKSAAEYKVHDLNSMSLFEDKFYFFKEEDTTNE